MIFLPYPVTPVFAFARAVSPRLGMNGVRGRSSIFRESFLIQSSVDLAVSLRSRPSRVRGNDVPTLSILTKVAKPMTNGPC
jgi:hypothetical protein